MPCCRIRVALCWHEAWHQRSASLKVILVSGYPQATVRASPDQQNGDEFLAKPYCAAVLISKVQMALQTEDAPKEAGQIL
jgi:FixJ family two-component response regulator